MRIPPTCTNINRYPLDGKNGISLATIVAHIVMIPVAKASGVLGSLPWAGSRRTLLIATLFIVMRGVAFALIADPWALLAICFLDGLSAGAFGVLAVLMVGDLAVGSGRANVLQGAMAACIGMGASISNGIFGAVTESEGVNITFWCLSAFAGAAVIMLLLFVKDLHDYEATYNAANLTLFASPKKAFDADEMKQSYYAATGDSTTPGGSKLTTHNPSFERGSSHDGGDVNELSRSLFPSSGGKGVTSNV